MNRTIDISVSLDEGAIAAALISAFEGGSRYWARGYRVPVFTPEYTHDTEGRVKAYGRIVGALLSAGCVVAFTENANTDAPVHRTVTRADVIRALGILAAEHPRAFALVLSGGDQDSGDLLLQLAALGEVLYG